MRSFLRSPLALLASLAALRSAGFRFGILNIDESDFVVIGNSIAHGLLPYRDLGEIKPPMSYLSYLPSALFGGFQIWPVQVLALGWLFATAWLLKMAARDWLRERRPELAEDAGWCAAWLFVLSLLCEIPSFSSELMLDLPTAAGLYFLVRSEARSGRGSPLRSIFLAGLCAGLASLYKHQGIALALALGAGFLVSARGRLGDSIARLALAAPAFLLPWIFWLAVYAGLHALPQFLDWVFVRNFAYAGQGGAGSALARFAQSTLLCCGATLVPWVFTAIALWRGARDGSLLRERVFAVAASLLAFAWLAVSAGGRLYEHYYLQFAPPLALLGAAPLAGLLANPSRSRSITILLYTGIVLPIVGLTGYSWARGAMGQYPGEEPRSLEVARFVDAHSEPSETMFVWGHFTPIYVMAKRLPGTRYIHTSVQMGNFDPEHLDDSFDPRRTRSDRDVAAAIADLQSRKPALLVDTAPADIHAWHRIPLSAFPDLQAEIDAHYAPIGHPANATVYRRVR